MIERRIVPRDQVNGAIYVAPAPAKAHTCGRTIVLDGRVYRCGRAVRSYDRQHDGIHDAFCECPRGGAVRW